MQNTEYRQVNAHGSKDLLTHHQRIQPSAIHPLHMQKQYKSEQVTGHNIQSPSHAVYHKNSDYPDNNQYVPVSQAFYNYPGDMQPHRSDPNRHHKQTNLRQSTQDAQTHASRYQQQQSIRTQVPSNFETFQENPFMMQQKSSRSNLKTGFINQQSQDILKDTHHFGQPQSNEELYAAQKKHTAVGTYERKSSHRNLKSKYQNKRQGECQTYREPLERNLEPQEFTHNPQKKNRDSRNTLVRFQSGREDKRSQNIGVNSISSNQIEHKRSSNQFQPMSPQHQRTNIGGISQESTSTYTKGTFGNNHQISNTTLSSKVPAAPSSGNLTNAEKLAIKYQGSSIQQFDKRVPPKEPQPMRDSLRQKNFQQIPQQKGQQLFISNMQNVPKGQQGQSDLKNFEKSHMSNEPNHGQGQPRIKPSTSSREFRKHKNQDQLTDGPSYLSQNYLHSHREMTNNNIIEKPSENQDQLYYQNQKQKKKKQLREGQKIHSNDDRNRQWQKEQDWELMKSRDLRDKHSKQREPGSQAIESQIIGHDSRKRLYSGNRKAINDNKDVKQTQNLLQEMAMTFQKSEQNYKGAPKPDDYIVNNPNMNTNRSKRINSSSNKPKSVSNKPTQKMQGFSQLVRNEQNNINSINMESEVNQNRRGPQSQRDQIAQMDSFRSHDSRQKSQGSQKHIVSYSKIQRTNPQGHQYQIDEPSWPEFSENNKLNQSQNFYGQSANLNESDPSQLKLRNKCFSLGDQISDNLQDLTFQCSDPAALITDQDTVSNQASNHENADGSLSIKKQESDHLRNIFEQHVQNENQSKEKPILVKKTLNPATKPNGINMNIDRYNEKRQAKMARFNTGKNQLLLNKPLVSQSTTDAESARIQIQQQQQNMPQEDPYTQGDQTQRGSSRRQVEGFNSQNIDFSQKSQLSDDPMQKSNISSGASPYLNEPNSHQSDHQNQNIAPIITRANSQKRQVQSNQSSRQKHRVSNNDKGSVEDFKTPFRYEQYPESPLITSSKSRLPSGKTAKQPNSTRNSEIISSKPEGNPFNLILSDAPNFGQNIKTAWQPNSCRNTDTTQFKNFDPNIFKNHQFNSGITENPSGIPNGPQHKKSKSHHQPYQPQPGSKFENPSGSVRNNQQASSSEFLTQSTDRFNCITKFAFATSVGHIPGNPGKKNQDSYVLVPNLMGQLGLHLFAVGDGHGQNGHLASQYIKQKLPEHFTAQANKHDDIYGSSDLMKIDEFYNRIPQYLNKCYKDIHKELINTVNFDCSLSGSTLTSILFDRNTIFCANSGDSRAVLYSFQKQKKDAEGKTNDVLKITPMSVDHKPSLQIEQRRIEKMGGRVDTIRGPQGQKLGPERVWLKDVEMPGLAMSRSLGDQIAHSAGVSTEPEVMKFEVGPEHKFIVIASDGVWEFLSNEQIGQIVWPYYLQNSPEQAGNAIVRAAAQKWRQNDNMVDDITCVTIFLEVDHVLPTVKSYGKSSNIANVNVKYQQAQHRVQDPCEQPIINPSRPFGTKQKSKVTVVNQK